MLKFSHNSRAIILDVYPQTMKLAILKFTLVRFAFAVLKEPQEAKPALLVVKEHALVEFLLCGPVFTIALEVTLVEFPCVGFFLGVLRILVGEDQNALSVILVIEEVSCVGVPLLVSELS